jgi:hypothetical protein
MHNKLGFMTCFRNSLFFVQFLKVNGYTEITAAKTSLRVQTWPAGTGGGPKGGSSIQLPQ